MMLCDTSDVLRLMHTISIKAHTTLWDVENRKNDVLKASNGFDGESTRIIRRE